MKNLSQALFWLGLLSIPLSWVMWYLGADIEVGREVIDTVRDPDVRAALAEAHAERWGLFVGLWPVTLFVLSLILEKRGAAAPT